MTATAVASRAAPQWHAPLSRLPRALLEPEQPVRALAVGWVFAFLPSILLGALVTGLLPQVEQPKIVSNGLLQVALTVGVSPIGETLIMGTLLLIMLRILPPTAAVLVSAIGWGLAHSAIAAAWGLVIWWPFVIFSTLFVTWRQKSLAAAFGIAAATHALHNLLPSLLLLVAPT